MSREIRRGSVLEKGASLKQEELRELKGLEKEA
jgi:hypothetical protein